jgi:SRSO17 transposase
MAAPAASETSESMRDDELVHSAEVAMCLTRLASFADRYKPLIGRTEHRTHLQMCLEGLVSGLERKSVEPIATAHGVYRRPLQHFVGAGKWDDWAIREEMQKHIVEEIGESSGVLVLDGSAFPKKGEDSVGVARQWCGRFGKVENCQIGVFIVYSTTRGGALLDGDLYLPEQWVDDDTRRDKTHVPDEIQFRTRWQIADELVASVGSRVPHEWIVGDDEFGRPSEFRDRLAERDEQYLLDVPSNTQVRKPPTWPGRGVKWCSVAKRQARRESWTRVRIRDGEKGPIEVDAFCTRVQTRRPDGPPREETLLVMRNIQRSQTWYLLAPEGATLDVVALVRVAAHRHHIEEIFELAKGEAGFDHYEVRAWVGWHHHITLSMLALWFLVLERRRLGKKLPR